MTVFCIASTAGAALDPTAERVVLQQKSCMGIDNCFNDMATLTSWIWGTRQPTASAPLVVDIGPGTFGPFSCPSASPVNGYVTLRGSGRDRTMIQASSGLGAVYTVNCDGLGFQDLRVQSYLVGVFWTGAGSSTWTNVDIEGDYSGWYDDACGGLPTDPAAGTHYFFGSRIESQNLTFYGECGSTWLYGSEVLVNPKGVYASVYRNAIRVANRASVQLFGSSVRIVTQSAPGSDPATDAIGVLVGPSGNSGVASGYGEFYMHGGLLSLSQQTIANGKVIGVRVDRQGGGNAAAHIVDTAWDLTAGAGGSSTRVDQLNGGRVYSPFIWPADSGPPRAVPGDTSSPLAQSITGFDMYVETDCSPTGCGGSGMADSHLMVYQAGCNTYGTPWFDQVRGKCRNQ